MMNLNIFRTSVSALRSQRQLWPVLLYLALLCPFAQAQDDEEFFDFDEGTEAASEIADPLESLNRMSFALNDKLYRGFLKPLARGLRVLPVGVRTSASHFFSNLGTPISAISALLQADPKNAATEISRFAVNSTLGILGLFDPATQMGLEQDEEDLAQTLGRYGLGHGFYLVLPFYGASSLRDALALTATTALNPVYANLDAGDILALTFVKAEVALSLDEDSYEAFYDSALDPYIFFRSAWVQNRAGKVDQ